MKDVEKRTENVNTDEDPSGWRPYYTFIDSLREKYAKNEGQGNFELLFFANLPLCYVAITCHVPLLCSLLPEVVIIIVIII